LIVAVASGKGGTGKTSVAVNLAISLGSAQLLDCDVEEPNANLLLHLEQKKRESICVKIPKSTKQNAHIVATAPKSVNTTPF
jgi:MinD superfamily P-loop ATPase